MAKKRVARKRPGGAKAAAKKTVRRTAGKAAGKPVKKRAAVAAKKQVAKRTAKKYKRKASKPAATQGLLTLTEVSQRTGISMPTLQRYKKEYQNRLQAVGKGRTQRYKVGSLATFKQIKKENLKKRGRPRKSAAAPKAVAKPAAAPAAAPAGLISLSEIGRRTGISYPTLLRYVKLHGARIPSHGKGRKRRFPVAAVPVFRELRQESRRGRRKGSPRKKAAAAAGGMVARMRRLEKSHAGLEKQLKRLMKALSKPLVRG